MGLNPYDPNVTVAMMEEELAMKQAEDTLVAELRELHCAAGPWRTDVENAPREWVIVWHKEHPNDWFKARLSIEGHWETARYERTLTPDAFSVPNPTQVTT